MIAPIRYMPHHNCADVARWLGWDNFCVGEGDSDLPLDIRSSLPVEPGQWLSRDGDTIHITDDEPGT